MAILKKKQSASKSLNFEKKPPYCNFSTDPPFVFDRISSHDEGKRKTKALLNDIKIQVYMFRSYTGRSSKYKGNRNGIN